MEGMSLPWIITAGKTLSSLGEGFLAFTSKTVPMNSSIVVINFILSTWSSPLLNIAKFSCHYRHLEMTGNCYLEHQKYIFVMAKGVENPVYEPR